MPFFFKNILLQSLCKLLLMSFKIKRIKMSNYHLLIIQHSYQFLKKRECLYIKVVIFAMGNSSNTGEFLRRKPTGKLAVPT